MKTPDYHDLVAAIEDGSIEKSSAKTLRQYLSILCKNSQQTPKSEDIIMGITINHVSMKQHIDRLNEQNKKTQRWVMVLAVASLIGTATQSVCAIRAEMRAAKLSTAIATQRQPPEIRSGNPFLEKHPSLHQATSGKESLESPKN